MSQGVGTSQRPYLVVAGELYPTDRIGVHQVEGTSGHSGVGVQVLRLGAGEVADVDDPDVGGEPVADDTDLVEDAVEHFLPRAHVSDEVGGHASVSLGMRDHHR